MMIDDAIQVLAERYVKNPTDGNFNNLYEKLNKKLRFFIWKYVKYQRDANDVVDEILQRTYNTLFTNLHSYDYAKGTFITWLYTIAKHESMQYIMEGKQVISFDEAYICFETNGTAISNRDYLPGAEATELYLEQSVFEIDYEFQTGSLDAEMEHKKAEDTCRQILETIESLDDKYKDILISRLVDNLSYDEIAIKYKLNINTVRTRLKKGKSILISIIPR